jgi:hypothetical protein
MLSSRLTAALVLGIARFTVRAAIYGNGGAVRNALIGVA